MNTRRSIAKAYNITECVPETIAYMCMLVSRLRSYQ